MIERTKPGVFADVSVDPAGSVWIVSENPRRKKLRIEKDGTRAAKTIMGTPHAIFPRISAEGPALAILFQCGPDAACWIGGMLYRYPQLGPMFATHHTAIEWNGTGWTVGLVTSRPTATLTRGHIALDGTFTEAFPRLPYPSSQGLLSIAADGSYRRTDDFIAAGKPQTAGGLTVREAGNPDRIAGVRNGREIVVATGFGSDPKVAQKHDGSYVVVARGLKGREPITRIISVPKGRP